MPRKLFICLLTTLCAIVFSLKAQKLPNIQDKPLRAPANFKPDGRDNEWGKFQAYNKAIDLYYSLANDNDNLYLIVKADKPRVIDKIIDVGIMLMVNTNGKKSADAKGNVAITFPLIDVAPGQRIIWYAGAKVHSSVPLTATMADRDTNRYSTVRTDSLIAIANRLLDENAKIVEVKGAVGIDDPLISRYNEEQIKTGARFDNSGAYIYELVVPLKYFGLSISGTKQFNYSLHLESRLTKPKRGMVTRYVYPNHMPQDVDQDLDSTTDFWATATLAVK